MRGTRTDRLALASRRYLDGKGAVGGDQIGPNPTDRAKNGTKKSFLVEGGGGPVSFVVSGAQVHDTKLLEQTLQTPVVERPDPKEKPQNLCLDKAYDNPTGEQAATEAGYIPHIRRIGEEKLPGWRRKRKHPARRWVVERTLAWLSKCRAILIRYDKKARNYAGLLQLASSLLWYRRLAFKTF